MNTHCASPRGLASLRRVGPHHEKAAVVRAAAPKELTTGEPIVAIASGGAGTKQP